MSTRQLKNRLKQSLRRRVRRSERRAESQHAPTAGSTPMHSSFRSALAELGTEVWRLGRRITANPDASNRIRESHVGLVRCLTDLGVRIDDPLGQTFVEGMNADVIDLPEGADPANEPMVITDVLKPAVFVDDVCVVTPQIIVERKDGNE